jgi:uncharacterized membrane protein YkvA (DUF1232 family)
MFTGSSRLMNLGTMTQMRLAWRLLRDPRVSSLKFALPALAAAYVATPIDALPDVLLGIGQTDDVGLAVIATLLLLRIMPLLAPQRVVREHLREMGVMGADHEAPLRRPGRVIDAEYRVRR